MVLARNMVVRKRSLALNERMGKCRYGCGITGIVLWNSEITGALAVEGWILAVRRQVISVNKQSENGPKVSHNIGQRSTVLKCHESPFMHHLYSNTDGFHRINGLRNSAMFFLCEVTAP